MVGIVLVVIGIVLVVGVLVAWPFVTRPSRTSSPVAAVAPPPSTPGSFLFRPPVIAAAAVICVAGGLAVGVLVPTLLSSPLPSRPSASTADPLAAMEQELRADPNNVEKLLDFGHRAVVAGQLGRAIPVYKHVLELDPKNVDATTHMGGVLVEAGHVDQGLARLDEALARDPKFAEAHWYKAYALYRGKQDYAGTVRELEAFLEVIPTGPDADRARAMIEDAKKRAASPPAAVPAAQSSTPKNGRNR